MEAIRIDVRSHVEHLEPTHIEPEPDAGSAQRASTLGHIKRAGMKHSGMNFPGRQRADVKVASPVLDPSSSQIILG